MFLNQTCRSFYHTQKPQIMTKFRITAVSAAIAIVGASAACAQAEELTPKKHVLMEIYTGMWCGNCPRGHAAAENLQKTYGDEAVVVMYHFNDQLQTIKPERFPLDCKGLAPRSTLDRGKFIDPYLGSSGSGYGILTDFKRARKVSTPIDITIEAEWNHENPNIINTSVSLRSDSPIEEGTKVEFILTGNGLYDENWMQHNYLSGTTTYYQIEETDRFSQGPQLMSIEHDNVALISSRARRDTPLAVIDEGKTTATASYSFNLISCKSQLNNGNDSERYLAIEFPHHLNIVAVVTDAADNVINCIRTEELGESGTVGVSTLENDYAASVSSANGQLHLTAPTGCPYAVFSLDGTIISQGHTTGQPLVIHVRPGIYVVKTGNRISKTIVK